MKKTMGCVLALAVLLGGCGLPVPEDTAAESTDTPHATAVIKKEESPTDPPADSGLDSGFFRAQPATEGVWDITDGRAESPSYVDIYVVEGEDRALVIDAGVSGGDLLGYVRTLTDKPLDLVLTHGHGDHVAAAMQFDSIYISSKDFGLLRPYVPFEDFDSSRIKDLKGGEIFDLGGCLLEVLALPGHTQGSVILLDRERQLLFGGDAMGSGSLWMQLRESTPVETFRDEIQRIEQAVQGLTGLKLLLGHSCMMGQYPDAGYITDTRIAAEKIVSGEITGRPSGRMQFPGSVAVSYGQMTEFLYMPDKIMEDE